MLLLLLEGQLIVDYVGGEFRVLARGDAVRLSAGELVSLVPVAGEAIFLRFSAVE